MSGFEDVPTGRLMVDNATGEVSLQPGNVTPEKPTSPRDKWNSSEEATVTVESPDDPEILARSATELAKLLYTEEGTKAVSAMKQLIDGAVKSNSPPQEKNYVVRSANMDYDRQGEWPVDEMRFQQDTTAFKERMDERLQSLMTGGDTLNANETRWLAEKAGFTQYDRLKELARRYGQALAYQKEEPRPIVDRVTPGLSDRAQKFHREEESLVRKKAFAQAWEGVKSSAGEKQP